MRKSMIAMLAIVAMVASGCLIWAMAELHAQPGGGGGPGGLPKKAPLGGGAGPGGFGGGFGPMAPAKLTGWEYRVVSHQQSEAALNKLGSEGWELTVVVPAGQGTAQEYIFRRPATGTPRIEPKAQPEPAPKQNAEDRVEFRVYRLKHASANNVAGVIGELMADRNKAVRVVADPATNQLLLKGPLQFHVEAEAILQRLDVPTDAEAPARPAVPKGPRGSGPPDKY